MRLRILLVILAMPFATQAAPVSPPAAEELLARTIAYHDPQGVWAAKAIELVADVSISDAMAKSRGYATRRDRIRFDRPAGRFQYRTYRGADRIDVFGDERGFRAFLNRSIEIPDKDRRKHRLLENQLPGLRDYFSYVYGIPMKLRDPGTLLDPEVKRVEFAGRDVYALRVTYEPEVGNETWDFYVDPDTDALVGCRFYYDPVEDDGEYIVFQDEIEGPEGLRLPKMRLWYRNQDGEYIASDDLLLVNVTASSASRNGTLPLEQRALSTYSKDPHRQFDFWIGEWDVNLRMFRDGEWHDRITARASIYSILDGKAILELWDSTPIKGFSLRHYDPSKQKWVLWLNWPSPNSSGMSSLEGSFRHGRGDFFSESKNADGEMVTERYSFNDITPSSLRWDDAYTTDGVDWRSNWIMEWSRVKADPKFPPAPGNAPTFVDGSRCPDERFRAHEEIAGDWRSVDGGASLTARKILDGCAVIGFTTVGDEETFWISTWDTREQRWEMSVLTDDRDAPLERYTSTDDPWVLASPGGSRQTWSVGDELIWRRDSPDSAAGSEIRFQRR